jgi:hypothetical protein
MLFAALHMSQFGPKRTYQSPRRMSVSMEWRTSLLAADFFVALKATQCGRLNSNFQNFKRTARCVVIEYADR